MSRKINYTILLGIFFIIFTSSLKSEELKNITNNLLMGKITYEEVEVNRLEDIYLDRKKDFVFSKLNIDIENFSVEKRKEIFIKLLLPSIKIVRKEILLNKEIVKNLKEKKIYTMKEQEYLNKIFSNYGVRLNDFKSLEEKMIVYPTSLILAQGALESAWGTSRFFKEANNIFGMWSKNKKEPRIPAKNSRGSFVPNLKVYKNLKDSVGDITMLMSRSKVYKEVREYINKNEDVYKISEGLNNYSEEGRLYVKKVKTIIKYNNLSKYDNKEKTSL